MFGIQLESLGPDVTVPWGAESAGDTDRVVSWLMGVEDLTAVWTINQNDAQHFDSEDDARRFWERAGLVNVEVSVVELPEIPEPAEVPFGAEG